VQSVATWLVARPHNAVLALAGTLLLPVLHILSGAIIVLIVLQRGVRLAVIEGAIAGLLLAAVAFFVGAPVTQVVASIAATLVPSILLAAMLQATRSLALTLQVSAILAAAAMLVFQNYWQNTAFFMVWFFSYHIVVILFYLCMLTLGMRIAERRVAATTFTLFMASLSVGITIGAGMLGWLDSVGGFQAMLAAMVITIAVSGLVAVGFSWRAGGPASVEEDSAGDGDPPGAVPDMVPG